MSMSLYKSRYVSFGNEPSLTDEEESLYQEWKKDNPDCPAGRCHIVIGGTLCDCRRGWYSNYLKENKE